MANYVFETMTATDASNFTSSDRLFFESASVSTLGVTDNPAVSGPLSSTAESITLTSGGQTLTFAAAQLSYASTHDGLIFFNGDELEVGSGAANTLAFTTDAGAGHHAAIYGFDGNDTISGTSSANDTLFGGDGNDVITGSSSHTDSAGHFTENDYYMGGNGADSITGGDGNDHIYGNAFGSTVGAADGNDTINAGLGNDYVNGNAGNDFIHGNDGNDRLYGGGGDDTLRGDNGNDYLQGNKGHDLLLGGDGNDTLHGGADDDTVAGTNGDDLVFGDAGNDELQGGNGIDTMTGGTGNDVFATFTGQASIINLQSPTTDPDHDRTDVITDFTSGQDTLYVNFAVDHVYHQQTGVTFTSVDAALTYAEQLLDGQTAAGTEVASIQVGADTYLFYNDQGGNVVDGTATHTIDQVIKLAGVTSTTLTTDDFTF